jgi:hypothetical protein
VRRADRPTADGSTRGPGGPAREDPLVPRAVGEVLPAITDPDVRGVSDGFRPGRRPPEAGDARAPGRRTTKGTGGLAADSRSGGDTREHGGRGKGSAHRGADRRVVRRIQQWVHAGVREEGARPGREVGTVHGGSGSPRGATRSLHDGVALGVPQWRQTQATGDAIVVRFVEDVVVGFQDRHAAERVLAARRERVAPAGRARPPDTTRRIAGGPVADRTRRGRGQGTPDTVPFLGVPPSCGTQRRGMVPGLRQPIRPRGPATRQAGTAARRRRRHVPLPEPGASGRSGVAGHGRPFGVPRQGPASRLVRRDVERGWRQGLLRRRQPPWLPGNRMRDCRLSGSVAEGPGKQDSDSRGRHW